MIMPLLPPNPIGEFNNISKEGGSKPGLPSCCVYCTHVHAIASRDRNESLSRIELGEEIQRQAKLKMMLGDYVLLS